MKREKRGNKQEINRIRTDILINFWGNFLRFGGVGKMTGAFGKWEKFARRKEETSKIKRGSIGRYFFIKRLVDCNIREVKYEKNAIGMGFLKKLYY